MGSLKRRSLRTLERLPVDGPEPDKIDQPAVIEQSALPGTVPSGEEENWNATPQYDFPPPSNPVMTEEPGPSRECSQGVEQQASSMAIQGSVGPITPLPVTVQDTPSPSPMLSAPRRGGPVRERVVIRAPRRRAGFTITMSARKRHILAYATVVTMLLVILSGTLASVSAASDTGGGGVSHLVSPLLNLFGAREGHTADIAAQSATPTPTPTPTSTPIIAQNDPDQTVQAPVMGPANSTGGTSPADAGNLNRFAYGYCTYWANMRYHDLTGHWIPWLGNAYEWAYQAGAYGWVVSDSPNPNGPSIIVLMPDVYQSGSLGHVAVVESINSDGSVLTSNWNWASPWATTVYVTFSPGPGVKFVWYPG